MAAVLTRPTQPQTPAGRAVVCRPLVAAVLTRPTQPQTPARQAVVCRRLVAKVLTLPNQPQTPAKQAEHSYSGAVLLLVFQLQTPGQHAEQLSDRVSPDVRRGLLLSLKPGRKEDVDSKRGRLVMLCEELQHIAMACPSPGIHLHSRQSGCQIVDLQSARRCALLLPCKANRKDVDNRRKGPVTSNQGVAARQSCYSLSQPRSIHAHSRRRRHLTHEHCSREPKQDIVAPGPWGPVAISCWLYV